MNPLLLCIDDEPARYSRLVLPDGWVAVCACRPEDYAFYLDRHRDPEVKDRIAFVCLDHDMPFEDGRWFARRVGEDLHRPVVLTSANEPGRHAMYAILAEYGIEAVHLPVTLPGWKHTLEGLCASIQRKVDAANDARFDFMAQVKDP